MRSIFTFQTFKRSEPTHLFSSFKILRNFSALVWLLVAFTCSLANASSRRRIDFFTVTEPGEARHNIGRQMSTDIFKYIHTMTQRHATETRKAVNSQSFIYSIIRVRLKKKAGNRKPKILEGNTQTTDDRMIENYTGSHILYHRNGVIQKHGSRQRNRCMERGAETCRENSQQPLFPIEPDKVSTLP